MKHGERPDSTMHTSEAFDTKDCATWGCPNEAATGHTTCRACITTNRPRTPPPETKPTAPRLVTAPRLLHLLQALSNTHPTSRQQLRQRTSQTDNEISVNTSRLKTQGAIKQPARSLYQITELGLRALEQAGIRRTTT